MAPQDATMYWLSKRTRNDLFLLYCFADRGRPTEQLRAAVAERSARITDLCLRLRELPADVDYPFWTRCEFGAEQFVEHQLAEPNWSHLLEVLGNLLGTGVDAAVHAWRLHVFRSVADAPGMAEEPALVVVLQMSHALADGRRASALARALFSGPDAAVVRDRSRPGSVASDGVLIASALGLLRMPTRLSATVVRGYHAFQAQQRLARLTEAGELPPPGPDFPPSVLNRSAAEGVRRNEARILVFPADDLRVPGRTVTVVVLTAVSLALARYLADRGEPPQRLGAQVPMALPDPTASRNNYRNLGVDLFVDEPDLCLRADKIAAALADRRVRARHPLLSAQDRVTATVPAPMLRRDVDRFPLDAVPDSIAGHTVVSSVDRGPADFSFGGGDVRFTAGFPALGSVMHLTHGVHGLGDTVTISLHADPAVLPDIDAYAAHLRAALLEARRTRLDSAAPPV
ncbi:WS/DGAT domain-containing protein [Nocardia asiatica]|uniref:WS/DGAT domain-containing protein n=1 Tax=Nocardia asiatica TaxID=209252 RepID=UPI0024548C2C|nr:WS/DGAT domain-containing protein [Nocardia asiatica]